MDGGGKGTLGHMRVEFGKDRPQKSGQETQKMLELRK